MVLNIFLLFSVIFINQIKLTDGNLNIIRGVNLGGWLVLEPWITPSLFYVSFGMQNNFPMDMYSFCDHYSPDIANLILLRHWDNWIQESDIKFLAESGINTLRVPIGDWMYFPYGPYDKTTSTNVKCTDGSINKVDWIFKIAQKYNLKIILDLHGIKGSQNGFDNSGQTANLKINYDKFEHWNIRAGNWIGQFNTITKQYDSIDLNNIQYSLNLLEHLFKIYSDKKKYPNLYGFGILNEPWEYIPELVLKKFYQDSFNIFSKYMDADVAFIFHDSFRPQLWEKFTLSNNYKHHPIYIDTHHYTAWAEPFDSFFRYIDSNKKYQAPKSIYPYIIGEFSLAVDNCEMWLNGFMDNIEGFPKYDCAYKNCPLDNIYLNKILISNSIYGPTGTGISRPKINSIGIVSYECPTTIQMQTHFNINNPNSLDIESFENFNEMKEKDFAISAFQSKTKAYENIKSNSIGWIFWNFKIESKNYQWDFIEFINMTKMHFDDKFKSPNSISNSNSNSNFNFKTFLNQYILNNLKKNIFVKIFIGIGIFVGLILFCYILILIFKYIWAKNNKYQVYEQIITESNGDFTNLSKLPNEISSLKSFDEPNIKCYKSLCEDSSLFKQSNQI